MEFPANSIRAEQPTELGRRAAKGLLNAAFPNMPVGKRITKAARFTGRSEKTVQNWLDGTHEMKLGDGLSLLPLITFETFIRILNKKG